MIVTQTLADEVAEDFAVLPSSSRFANKFLGSIARVLNDYESFTGVTVDPVDDFHTDIDMDNKYRNFVYSGIVKYLNDSGEWTTNPKGDTDQEYRIASGRAQTFYLKELGPTVRFLMAEFTDRADCVNALSLDRAHVYANDELGLLEDGQILLVWEVANGIAEECKDWEKANRITLEDFNAGAKNFSSLYRSVKVSVKREKGVTKIEHLMAVGYHETAVHARARPSKGYDDQIGDDYFVVDFHNINPAFFDSIAATLQTESYNGLPSLRVDHKLEEDGSGLVQWHVGTPEWPVVTYRNYGTPYEVTQTNYFNVPKDEVDNRIELSRVTGGSAEVRYSAEGDVAGTADVTVWVKALDESGYSGVPTSWSCSVREYSYYYFMASDPTSNPLASPPQGWTYRKSVRNNKDGTFDIVITYIHTQYRKPIEDKVVKTSSASTIQETQQLGRTTETLADFTQEVGHIKRQQTRVNADCSQDVVTTDEEVIDQEGYAGTDSAGGHSNSTTHTQTEAINSVTRDGNTIKRVSSAPTEAGMFRTTEEEISGDVLTATTTSGGPFQSSESISSKNEDSPASVGIGLTGQITSASSIQNDLGLYDNRTEERTAYNGDDESNVTNPLYTEKIRIGKNEADAPACNNDIGTIGSLSDSLNDFKLHDTTRRTKTAKRAYREVTTGRNAAYVEKIRVMKNQTEAQFEGYVPAQQDGVTVTGSASINEYGLLDGAIRIKDKTGDDVSGDAGGTCQRTDDLELYKGASSFSVEPGGVGVNKSVSASLNDDGAIDYSIKTSTFKATEKSAVDTIASSLYTEETTIKKNQELIDP